MLLVATLLIVLGTSVYGQIQITIRTNGKLCSEWIVRTGSEMELQYTANEECGGDVAAEVLDAIVRICCPAKATTTFPQECGKQKYNPLRQGIVGGTEAQRNSWPWLVRISENGDHICGGTLIDTRHVVTAAHCITIPIVTQTYRVHAGSHNINQPASDEQEIVPERIFIHEQYNKATLENDIAIIRLSRPVTISDKINIICLPGPEVQNKDETVWVGK
ncbi:unnamed protein product [Rotaria sordida]|uniref:Peptidase S1 domain-containing protein n=1 Tax=Rotaria sordida TaxID=392033 RepID=A0A814XTX7_9BILA|nr:unnamed protein product [Rotaria sordida]CAF3892287.1 unnamed protein product [Rotaria sordida]